LYYVSSFEKIDTLENNLLLAWHPLVMVLYGKVIKYFHDDNHRRETWDAISRGMKRHSAWRSLEVVTNYIG